jgi:hypothetical protein
VVSVTNPYGRNLGFLDRRCTQVEINSYRHLLQAKDEFMVWLFPTLCSNFCTEAQIFTKLCTGIIRYRTQNLRMYRRPVLNNINMVALQTSEVATSIATFNVISKLFFNKISLQKLCKFLEDYITKRQYRNSSKSVLNILLFTVKIMEQMMTRK